MNAKRHKTGFHSGQPHHQKNRQASAEDILGELRKLKADFFTAEGDFFKAETDDNRTLIEKRQYQLIRQIDDIAKKILESVADPSISEDCRDRLMGRYGSLMDQMAINIPWSDMRKGGEWDIQNEALQILRKYSEAHPQAKEVSRSIFMLYHHGAGIDREVIAENYNQEFRCLPPTQEYARQYVEAEINGKKFLEYCVDISLGVDRFSLDTDYVKLLEFKEMTEEHFSCILDVANWYRRIAYYQKVAGLTEGQHTNLERAIELHKFLIVKDPSMREFLEKLHREQEMENPD